MLSSALCSGGDISLYTKLYHISMDSVLYSYCEKSLQLISFCISEIKIFNVDLQVSSYNKYKFIVADKVLLDTNEINSFRFIRKKNKQSARYPFLSGKLCRHCF